MGKIKVLPDIIANQIAAGEVVERPAAIVKELVENSLDAQASYIRIRFKQGGKTYICVEDNGEGMSADDALLSLERHATSKIKTTADLQSISSFGFRGEALPSIASVSQFNLKSRHKDSDQGSETIVSAGKLLEHKVAGMPIGTQIEVAQLFKNVPARRKFLKTDATEANHIIKIVKHYAMAYPRVGFTLEENNKTILHTPATDSLKARIQEIYGVAFVSNLIPVIASGNLYGMVSKPGSEGKTHREDIHTFVNLRPIENRMIHHALLESFATFIPKGRYPIAFLFLNVDPSTIDINIHPNKKEIKFANENHLRSELISLLTETLIAYQNKYKQELIAPTTYTPAVMELRQPTIKAFPKPLPKLTSQPNFVQHPPQPITPSRHEIPEVQKPAQPSVCAPSSTTEKASFTHSWEYLCNLPKHYTLFKAEGKLIILNHRAAHERILYESILDGLHQTEIPQQNLLFPITLELPTSKEIDTTKLDSFGIHADFFGQNTLKINSIPQWLPSDRTEAYVHECLKIHTTPQSDTFRESFAQKASLLAIRSQDTLNETGIKKLIERLMQCQSPMTTPSGKATYWVIPFSEIDKKFSKNSDAQNLHILMSL